MRKWYYARGKEDTLKNLNIEAKVSAFCARGDDKRRSSIRGSLEKDASWICIRINFILVFVSRAGFHRLEIWTLYLLLFLSLSFSLSLSLYWTVSRELRSCRMEVWMEGRGCPSKTVFDRFIFPQRDLLLRDPLNFAVNVAIEDFFSVIRGGKHNYALRTLLPIKDLSFIGL